MRTTRLLLVGWLLQLKMMSRSAFDGWLGVAYPLFFATSVLMVYREVDDVSVLVGAAVGASLLGVWSAVSTTAAAQLQHERRQGTLELLVMSPASFTVVIVPATVAMATIGLYSFVVTLIWGRVVFDIPLSFDQPMALVAAAVATAVSVGVVGFLEAVASVRYRYAWALGAALEFPIWLVCGFVVPLDLLPDWLRPVAYVLPPTWGATAVRNAAIGGPTLGPILLCLALCVAYAAVGAWASRRMIDSARVHASLALA